MFLSLMGLFTCYWFDKYLLLRRYVVPFYLDKRLANTMMSMLPKYTVYRYFFFSLIYVYMIKKNIIII
jgi:hypothetical protein